MAIFAEQKKEIIKKYRIHDKDCGSSEVQIAILTERIRYLTDHLKANPKDFLTRRGLMMMVGNRSALLKYLKRHNPESYKSLVEKLGLRK